MGGWDVMFWWGITGLFAAGSLASGHTFVAYLLDDRRGRR